MAFSAEKIGTIKNTNKIVLYTDNERSKSGSYVIIDADKSDEYVKTKTKQEKKHNIIDTILMAGSVTIGGLTYALTKSSHVVKTLATFATGLTSIFVSHKLSKSYREVKSKQIAEKFDTQYTNYVDCKLNPDFVPEKTPNDK